MVEKQSVMAGLTPDKGKTKLLHGPALRYVGALPTSSELYNADGTSREVGNYNFEEEYLLGDNKITVRQYDSNNRQYRERIEYRRENQENDYYFIEYYETDMRPDIYCDITRSKDTLVIDMHKKSTFIERENRKLDTTIELYYKDAKNIVTHISTKKIERQFNKERGFVYETITNEYVE